MRAFRMLSPKWTIYCIPLHPSPKAGGSFRNRKQREEEPEAEHEFKGTVSFG